MTRSLLAIALILTTGAAAAAYPDKPITMVVAYSPGGGTDLIARHIQPYLEKYLGGGAKIVIELTLAFLSVVTNSSGSNAAPMPGMCSDV